MDYLLHVLILVEVYIVLSVSLDLVLGKTGMLSVAQGAFFGIGAYASAILTTAHGWPFILAAMAGIVCASVVSLAVSLPSLRLRQDYFVIATFGLQMIVVSVFNNWIALTEGPMGIAGIHLPVILAWKIDSLPEFLLIGAVLLALSLFVTAAISSSPYGRVLHALREDEVFTGCVGKSRLAHKTVIVAISAAMAAAAGSLYAHHITFIAPTSFGVMESILIASMVIVGGAGSLWGPVLGAVALVTLPELLRLVGIPTAAAANIRQILYGLALVACMLWRPQGLIGEYAFGREAKQR